MRLEWIYVPLASVCARVRMSIRLEHRIQDGRTASDAVMPIAMCCRLRRLWTVAHRADVNSYIRLSSEPARARTRLRPVPPPSLRGLESPRGYPRCLPGQSVEDARSQGEGA